MAVSYEWDAEIVDTAAIDPETNEPYNDVLDHLFGDIDYVLEQTPEDEGTRIDVVLVYNEGDDFDGLRDRAWAYVDDGKLPEWFEDAMGARIRKVPQKYHNELRRALARKAAKEGA